MIAAKIVWQDEHIVELRISASNSMFGGELNVYTTYEELSSIAERLRGFPRAVGERVQIEFNEPPGHSFRLALHARTAGACDARVDIVTYNPVGDSASFTLQVESAAIDSFVSDIETIIAAREGIAELR